MCKTNPLDCFVTAPRKCYAKGTTAHAVNGPVILNLTVIIVYSGVG